MAGWRFWLFGVNTPQTVINTFGQVRNRHPG